MDTKIVVDAQTGASESVSLSPEEQAALDAQRAAAAANRQRDDLLQQIVAIETMVTQRRLRDAILTPEGAAWLADVEAQIAARRAQL